MPRKKKTKEVATISPSRAAANAKRRAKNKAINQAHLREAIAAGNHHHSITRTLDKVDKLYENLTARKTPMTREDQAKFMSQLAALKVKLDSQFKLLNKYLPDLRSIEFKEGEGANPLAQAAEAWAKALNT